MNDAMKQGGEIAQTGLKRLVSEAQESGDPTAYWQGVLLALAGGMAAQIGHPAALLVLQRCAQVGAKHQAKQQAH